MIRSDNGSVQALRARAYVLAESGRFASAHAVEQALVAEGWPNIRRALDSEYARKAISERCMAAQAH